MKRTLFITFCVYLCFLGCKKDTKKTIPEDLNEIEENSPKKEVKVFFSKDEISLPQLDSIHFAKGNEVILFRPTEFDFGQRLEDTQNQTLLDLDGDFEELTNNIIDAYKNNKNVKISICEKPIIAIPQTSDTLYFSTSKNLYGILFCKPNSRPILKAPAEKNIIKQIETSYSL